MSVDINSNLTLLDHFVEAASEWTTFQLILCIVLSAVCIATIIGNSVVLYVFAKSKRNLRSPTHLLLANLAVTDLLVGLLVMPILISVTVFDWKWYWGKLSCRIADYVHFCLCATSMLSMTTVSLERFVGVRYPLHHKWILSKGRVCRLIIGIWILALVLTAGPLSVWPIKGSQSQSQFTCQSNLRPDFIFFTSITLYWIPISVTIYIYWLIYKTATTSSAELIKWTNQPMKSTVITTTTSVASTMNWNKVLPLKTLNRRPSKTEEEKYEDARKKQVLLVKKSAIIVIGMLILYGPLFFVFLLVGFKVPWFSKNVLLTVAWIRYASSLINTFLYVFAVPYYKKQLLRLLCNANGSQGKSSFATSTLLNIENPDSSFDSYRSSTDADTDETTIKSPQSPKACVRRRYCTSCGNALQKSSQCKICDDTLSVELLDPPEEWGTTKKFNCPSCMTIRFFDGDRACFCPICNHMFQPSKAKPDGKDVLKLNSEFLIEGGVTADLHLSMTEAVESLETVKNAKLNGQESEDPKLAIDRIRKSVIIPLKERRSQILTAATFNTSCNEDISWASIQELDANIQELEDIMTKLESEIIEFKVGEEK